MPISTLIIVDGTPMFATRAPWVRLAPPLTAPAETPADISSCIAASRRHPRQLVPHFCRPEGVSISSFALELFIYCRMKKPRDRDGKNREASPKNHRRTAQPSTIGWQNDPRSSTLSMRRSDRGNRIWRHLRWSQTHLRSDGCIGGGKLHTSCSSA